MVEEFKLPVKGADSCPHCGSKERVLEKIIAKLKEEGKLPKESFPKGASWNIPLFDLARTSILAPKMVIPIALIFWDICLECKAIYCTGVEIIEQPAELRSVPLHSQPPGTDFAGGTLRPG